MRGRIRSTGGHERQALATDWEVALCAPDLVVDPSALAGAGLSWVPTTVPSTAASALRSAGRWTLDGPARRFDAEDAWYRTSFASRPPSIEEQVALRFEGLATVADVWLNGAPILASESMFLEHEVSPGETLRDQNELVIRFRALDPLLGARRPRPRWRAPMVEHQQLRWFRSTLLGRTPGWSPPAAAVGPWRGISIERRRNVVVSDVRLRPRCEGERGILEVSARIHPLSAPLSRVELELERGGARHVVALEREGAERWVGRLAIEPVARWWPHTHGEPALYRALLRASTEAGVSDVDLGPIGFRDLALRTADGGFAIEVNGVAMFCRGACWMPLDPARLHVEPARYDEAVNRIRECGMNMIRLSGTTIYESDALFDACDERGVLVWQDFMFANMDYPGDDERFTALVQREVKEVLARMQGRPCVAVLCGNSEAEQQAAMWGAPRASWSQPLFHEVIAALAGEALPDVPYWPSSAHGGAFPHQNDAGTTSYYGVGAYLRPLEDARQSEVRFATECLAFSNVPEPRTVLAMPGGESIRAHHPLWKARAPRDLGAGWDFEDVRDHYLRELFRVDPAALRARDHDRYLALSRVVPGELMAAVFSEWRRARSSCSGGLVWFLRDLWPGAGWGVIDATGAPKAPFFYLRRVLQPVHLSLSDEGTNGLYIHVANDRAEPQEAQLEVTLVRAGDVVVAKASKKVSVAPRSGVEIAAASLFDELHDTSYAYRFGPASHDLVVATLTGDGDSTPIATGFFFPVGRPAEASSDVGLTAHASELDGGAIALRLQTRAFAFGVSIDAEGFVPDDDHFHLGPGAEHLVTLRRAGKSRGRCNVSALNSSAIVKVTFKA